MDLDISKRNDMLKRKHIRKTERINPPKKLSQIIIYFKITR